MHKFTLTAEKARAIAGIPSPADEVEKALELIAKEAEAGGGRIRLASPFWLSTMVTSSKPLLHAVALLQDLGYDVTREEHGGRELATIVSWSHA